MMRFCIRAMLLLAFSALCACATRPGVRQWTAQGWLSPAPSGEPEIIGLYDNEADCIAAGEAWMSRQVVGNPVYADCLPVDHD